MDPMELFERQKFILPRNLKVRKNLIHKKLILYYEYRRIIFAILLVISSLPIGYLAYRFTLKKHIENWSHTHRPSSQVWIEVLQSKNLQHYSNASLLHSVLYRLPRTIDHWGSVWTSKNRKWILVFQNPNKIEKPLLFAPISQSSPSTLSKSVPKTWKRVGVGWMAFQKTLDFLPKRIKAIPTKKKRSKKTKWKDPREIKF